MARPTFRYGICQYILWEEQEWKGSANYDFAYLNVIFHASTAGNPTAQGQKIFSCISLDIYRIERNSNKKKRKKPLYLNELSIVCNAICSLR